MKIARFEAGGRVAYGEIRDGEIAEIEGDVFGAFSRTTRRYALNTVRLRAPTCPLSCFGVGLNYRDHLGFIANTLERPVKVPQVPHPWRKGQSCVIGTGEPIVVPKDSNGNVQFEGELVVVIGKRCCRVNWSVAMDYVFGYSCGNDITERDWERKDFNLWRAKGADTFGPVGPWIVTDVDPRDIEMEVRLNGSVVQKTSTSELVFQIPAIIEAVSRATTLMPGDLIFTGTPGSPGVIKPGDVVEVELSGIGVLSNPVVSET